MTSRQDLCFTRLIGRESWLQSLSIKRSINPKGCFIPLINRRIN